MKHILRHNDPNDPKTNYYFLSHGEKWQHRPGYRLIGPTTKNRDKARRFDTHEEALAALKVSDDPPGWGIDEVGE